MAKYILTLFFFIKLSVGYIEKSSLTFVIDDTYSMENDIVQVINSANRVFDAVLNSKASQIENFILVTFNDPGVILRTVTKDRTVFKQALAAVKVHGGGDCPELSMGGIELALHESLDGSYVYVFSDASAKDHTLIDRVQSLAIKKKCQIVFLLTGKCTYTEGDVQYLVYHKLAESTNGQVFHIQKQQVSEIIKYITENVKNRKNPIVSAKFPAGYGHKLPIPVDDFTKEVVISVSGKNRVVSVTAPDGSTPKTSTIVDTEEVLIKLIEDTKPGTYVATIGGTSSTSVAVSGTTDIHFQHGFSSFKPTSINDTATRPIIGEKSHLSIALGAPENTIKLDSIEILGLDGKVLSNIPLILIDEKQQLYMTAKIDWPINLFKIAVKGHGVNKTTTFKGIAPTAIEPQKPDLVSTKYLMPSVVIVQGDQFTAEFHKPLKISCKVKAFPKPAITWEDERGAVLSSTVSTVELPYDYINILSLDKVNANSTYKCKATNSMGNHFRNIDIISYKKEFFEIVQEPENMVIKYKQSASMKCVVNADPPATINWYINSTILVQNNKHFHLSANNTILTIIDMSPNNVGDYICEARNEHNRKLMYFDVQIDGFEKPEIEKADPEIHAKQGRDVKINCRVTRGQPTPTIRWYFKSGESKLFRQILVGDDILYIRNLTLEQGGVYRCEATNDAGSDATETSIIVQYAPTIEKDVTDVVAIQGKNTTLHCAVNGEPKPEVQWYHNGTKIDGDPRRHMFMNHSIKFAGSVQDIGVFSCIGSNPLGSAKREINVTFIDPVTIVHPNTTDFIMKLGQNVVMPCVASGYPTPHTSWTFKSSDPEVSTKLIRSPDDIGLTLKHLRISNSGNYTCVANNGVTSAKLTYQLQILAPPRIINTGHNKLTAVKGDLVLQIPCKAVGNPTPEITWNKHGYNLAIGTEWYDMTENGTLIIKNVGKKSNGTFKCIATNKLGMSEMTYTVDVKEYPDIPVSAQGRKILYVLEGSTVDLECSLSHLKINPVRWYKDNRLLPNGRLSKARLSDSGKYVCRVSTFLDSRTGVVDVFVGSKPRFTRLDPELEMSFEDYDTSYLDCEAVGEPKPQINWFFNDNRMETTDMVNEFDMSIERRGKYTCIVYNRFGSIHRSFDIISRDCILDISKHLTTHQPLMLHSLPRRTLGHFENNNGNVIVNLYEPVQFYCPTGFKKLPGNEFAATCVGGTEFDIRGRKMKYSELECREELKTDIRRTGQKCQGANTELIRVGYDLFGTFLDIYEVCFDYGKNAPVFTKHGLRHSLSDIQISKEPKFVAIDLVPFNIDEGYLCGEQIRSISQHFDRWYNSSDYCCFGKRQLVNPRDLSAGVPQQATYTSLNVVPHWSTCNTKNWDLLEQKIRALAKESYKDLIVWTGTSGHLTSKKTFENTRLNDYVGRHQDIPHYLWKVVQNPASKSSLAIVQVNVPNLSMSEAYSHLKCKDICRNVPWLGGGAWRDSKYGFTFCCQLDDFERAFGYKGHFGNGNGKVLQNNNFIPELKYYLLSAA